jgi:gp32 DNA binding protein like
MSDFMAEIRKANEKLKTRFVKREPTQKPQKGKTRIRLLPGWNPKARGTYWRDYAQHYVKDLDDALIAVVPCASHIHGEDCPVCNELGKAIRASSSDEIIKQLEKSKANVTILLNVLLLDGEDPTTPVILEVKPSVMKGIHELMNDWDGVIFDPANGQELVINREGTGLLTKYSVQISPRKTPYDPKEVIPKLHDLDEYVSATYEASMTKAVGFLKSSGMPALGSALSSKPSLGFDSDAAERRSETVARATSSASLDAELSSLDDLV